MRTRPARTRRLGIEGLSLAACVAAAIGFTWPLITIFGTRIVTESSAADPRASDGARDEVRFDHREAWHAREFAGRYSRG